jgi:circadian clock protein KaiC
MGLLSDVLAQGIPKLPTGIPGFDQIGNGGLPLGRSTLVTGTPGSAKTVFCAQFLAEGIRQFEESGVFVTCEETPREISRNLRGFGWDIDTWVAEGKWAFIDATELLGEDTLVSGSFDFGGLMARIEYAVQKSAAKRVAIDSVGAMLMQFAQTDLVRREFGRLLRALREMNTTSVVTAERTEEYGSLSRCGIEEFVADNVIVLRNELEDEKRRRTIEILKYRGCPHHKGQYPFTVVPGQGIMIIPLSAMELAQRSSMRRISTGSAELDAMCGGGCFQDSVILVSGATGTGKSLMASTFVAAGARSGQRSLLLAFEEGHDQIFRNASGWGFDFDQLEADGNLKVVCQYPETRGLEDHLIEIKRLIDEYHPQRIAIDSLSALERVSSTKGYREFLMGLTSTIKQHEIAGLYTSTTATLLGGESVTESHISTIPDSIILLRYVEIFGEMRRGLTVLKMRGSMHDKDIREFRIDGQGMHIGRPFRTVTGILSGNFTYVQGGELDRLATMFREDQPAETEAESESASEPQKQGSNGS